MQKRPVWIFILLCGFTLGLGGCQSLSDIPHIPNPFGPPPPPSSVAVTPPLPLPSLSTDEDYPALLDMLEADNDRLKKELAGAMKDNARLKKELADAMEDNSLLKDLAAKKAR